LRTIGVTGNEREQRSICFSATRWSIDEAMLTRSKGLPAFFLKGGCFPSHRLKPFKAGRRGIVEGVYRTHRFLLIFASEEYRLVLGTIFSIRSIKQKNT
jgi:hypothetical protein